MSKRSALVTAAAVALLLGGAGCDDVLSSLPPQDAAAAQSGWTVLSAGTANLYAVSGASDSSVWAVGDRGTILYWNGTTLAPQTSNTGAALRGVWAVDATHVYAVGDGGTFLQLQGAAWQPIAAAVGVTQQILNGVWADSTRIVAVGSNGTVVLGTIAATGTTFQVLKVVINGLPATENLFGVTGTPMGVVTIVGALGVVLQLAPASTTPSRLNVPSFSKLLSAATPGGPMGPFLVGQQGSVYQAVGLSLVTGCPQSALRAATTTPTSSSVWTAGWDGTICQIQLTGGQPSSVTAFPYTDARWFNGIYASSATTLWVVGASGTMLHGLPTTPSTPTPGDASVGAADAGGG